MPLRMIKVRKVTADNALNVLVLTSAVTKEIADIMSFPPAQAAAGVLLLVFETIQSNRQECLNLAERCLNLLVDMRNHMADRWEAAPPSLLKAWARFEETLESIHKFVKGHAEQKWGSRLMKKNTIETSLKHHNRALDDAIRSFQMATLVNIHLAVGDATTRSKSDSPPESDPSATSTRESTLPPYVAEPTSVLTDVVEICTSPGPASATTDSFSLIGGSTRSASSSYELLLQNDSNLDLCTPQPLEEENLRITEHHGFSQYHQSQFRMKGKSRIKQGWWAGGVEGDIDGKKSIMLRYELDSDRRDAMKRWMRDVKILQNVYHPNLPQMVGYSNDESPTPFILLANVQTRLPQAMLLDVIKNASLATCAHLLLRFFQETLDAALYLQRQLNLSDSKLQDYVEHADFRIDAEKTVVMGLPPPEVDSIQSFRNYGLAWSIRDIYLKILPNRGYAEEPVDSTEQSVTAERQRKVNHLAVLARALLPGSDDIEVVTDRLQTVLHSIEDGEDEEAEPAQMTLRQIRKAAFAANTHQQAWRQKTVPPHKFSVGDLGYMPKGSDDWSDFVTLCNVLEDGEASFVASGNVTGMQGSWVNSAYERQDLAPYDLPGEIKGWAFAVPPEADLDIYIVHETATSKIHEAWDYLLDAGSALAKKHGVPPEELILVTRVGAEQRFRVRDLRRIQYWPASPNAPSYGRQVGFAPRSPYGIAQHGFGHQHFGGNHGNIIHGQDLAPKVLYLFTSSRKEYQAHFSLLPMPAPLSKGEKAPELDANIVKCFAYPTATYGFLNYVQLHAEDFEE
ncbi:hypothetical protein C8Q79DRAFT_1004593 [Trametes meyenii]|nr:hypothetical protein C8Q79DRAFT_1004593 [Trametes meyenii]